MDINAFIDFTITKSSTTLSFEILVNLPAHKWTPRQKKQSAIINSYPKFNGKGQYDVIDKKH
jgi:hypothetical protein